MAAGVVSLRPHPAAWLCLAWLWVQVGPARAAPAALSSEDLSRLARAILADEGYQRELWRPDEPGERPVRLHLPGGARGAGQGTSLATLVAWLAAGLLLALGLAALGAWLWRQREASGLLSAPATPGARSPVEAQRAEELAARGLYTEALRVLWATAVLRLAARARLAVPGAWTGREILGRLPASPAEAQALRALTLAVEAGLFGGRPAGPGDFERGQRLLQEIAS
jgi:hypothetical protein